MRGVSVTINNNVVISRTMTEATEDNTVEPITVSP